jgi:hypothetical protein
MHSYIHGATSSGDVGPQATIPLAQKGYRHVNELSALEGHVVVTMADEGIILSTYGAQHE